MSSSGEGRDRTHTVRLPRGRGLVRLILASILVFLMMSSPMRADAQDGAPRLAVEHEVSPESVSAIYEELTVAITVSGRGGRAGDLPLEVREGLPRRPLEAVLVLDRSGSMEHSDYQPTRIEAAKAAARTFLKQIQAGDSTALVSFNDFVSLDVPLTEDRDLSLGALKRLQPADGTAIGEGLYRAIEVLEAGAADSVKAIVLLSDGASNEGRDPRRAADAAREAGIPVFTVGIGTTGDDFDEPTLRHIAEVTGGEYLYAPDEEALSRVYERMGGKVINVAGVNASLEIKTTGLFEVEQHTTEDLKSSRGGSLVYHWDQIPVGESKTVYLRGRPTALLPGKRAAVIESVTLTYQSLGSDRDRAVAGGPVEIGFEDDVVDKGYYIDGISFDRTEGGYPGSNVYLRDDDVRADIELDGRPREEITSYASVYHSSGAAAANQEVSDGRTISHRLEHPGLAGRYIFVGTIGEESGLLYDTYEEKFFVVFNPPNRFPNFATATTIFGDPNWSKWKFSGSTKLHPRHPRILGAMAELLALADPATDLSDPRSAAEVLALNLRRNLVRYDLTFWQSNNDHPSDLDILDAGLGDCTDMAALFASLARSLNIPVRDVIFFFRDAADSEKGHAFTEVYVDGEWVHADPTWSRFDDVDSYLGLANMRFLVETRPGTVEYDRLLALKYSVGLMFPPRRHVFTHDLEDGDEFDARLVLVNFSAEESTLWVFGTGEPRAKDVRIRVLEDGGLDIERPRLDNGPELDPGEQDTADLVITVPDDIAEDVPPGGRRSLNIELELEYGDGAGGMITKTYPFVVLLERGV